jgi:hypothetical protein
VTITCGGTDTLTALSNHFDRKPVQLGPSLAPVSLDPLQLIRRGIVNDIPVDCSVDEGGVGVAKRIRGCHRSRVDLRRGIDSS